MSLALHLGLLGIAIVALAGASLRIAAALCHSVATRILGAIALVAGFAITEPLLVGLTGQGASPYLLTGAAVLTWAIARFLIASPDIRVRDQLADEWATSTPTTRAAIGGFGFFVVGVTAWQSHRPQIGWDGTVYHVAQPAVWIGTGHPGALHQTLANFPSQAYPKSFEVLIFWAAAISRSLIVITPLMMSFYVVAVLATLIGLRKAGVGAPIAVLATAAAVLIPWDLIEFGNAYNDVASIAFLAVTVALCLLADDEPAAIGLALVAAGVGIGIKTTNVPIAVIALLWVAWRVRHELRRNLRNLIPLGGWGIALGALWYVADAVKYHAPFWPFSRFPAGPPEPYVWREFGDRFLHEPVTTYHVVGWHNYVHYLGGVPLLILAAIVVALLSLIASLRDDRRFLLIGAGLVVLQTLLWSDAQFTGISISGTPFVTSAQRYLDVAPFTAVIVLGVAARRPGWLRYVVAPVLVVAIGMNVFVGAHWYLTKGTLPDAATCVALVLAGALAGVLTTYTEWFGDAVRRAVLAPVVTIGGALLLTVPASSYLDHYLTTGAQLLDGPVLRYLQTQPAWVHGHAPVAAGSGAYATWSGPRFTHPLSYVAPNESCPQLRQQAADGWVILTPTVPPGAGPAFLPLTYNLHAQCLSGLKPVKKIGTTLIYASPSLVTSVTR